MQGDLVCVHASVRTHVTCPMLGGNLGGADVRDLRTLQLWPLLHRCSPHPNA